MPPPCNDWSMTGQWLVNDWSMPHIPVEQCDVSTRLLIDQFYGVSEQLQQAQWMNKVWSDVVMVRCTFLKHAISSQATRQSALVRTPESTSFLVPWSVGPGPRIFHQSSSVMSQRLEVNARKPDSNRVKHLTKSLPSQEYLLNGCYLASQHNGPHWWCRWPHLQNTEAVTRSASEWIQRSINIPNRAYQSHQWQTTGYIIM
jgi:hypothetical protein